MGLNLKRGVISLGALLAISITFFWTTEASAVPAFAKQVGAECTLCHVGFPKLNETGIAFRNNGYRMEGDEGQNIWDQDLKNHLGLVAGLQYLNTDMEMPMVTETPAADASAADHRSGNSLDSLAATDMGGGSSMKMKVKSSKFSTEAVLIYFAGTLAPRVSYFTHLLATDDATTRALANVSLMDIAPNATLNLRFGETNIDLPYLSSSRKLTMTNYLIKIKPPSPGGGHGAAHGGATVSMCTNCGVSLTNTGIDANGIVPLGENASIEYVLAIGNNGVETTDNNVSSYRGYATLNYGEHRLGFIFNKARTGENDDEDQNATALGVSADLNFGSLNLMGSFNQFTQEKHGGDDLKVNSGALELTYVIIDNILGVARYDFNDTQDSDAKESQIVASLIYYRQPNVKFQAEVTQNSTTDAMGVDYDSTGVYGRVAFGF